MAALACLLALAAAGPAVARPPEWGGTARLDAEHTSDLFPGGDVAESSSLLRLTLAPQVQFRLSSTMRVRPWVECAVERHDDVPDADVEHWSLGVDLRRGPARLRLQHGFTDDELYFLSSGGDARVDRRSFAAEARLGLTPNVRLTAGVEREDHDFVAIHEERDNRRWITRLGVERGEATSLRTAVTWFFRDTRSITDLYTYRQNTLRLDVEGTLPSAWRGAARVEGGLRNYDTGAEFASNFGRQDHRWRARFAVGHPIAGGLAAEGYHAWRETESSRVSKDSVVRTLGLSLVYDR
ncbi:MAG: hypothetical protein ABIP29_07710 [Candidatus Eisenbacteria bacterium]